MCNVVGLTVCVGDEYLDYLSESIAKWKKLDRVYVVTDHKTLSKSVKALDGPNVFFRATTAFTDNGAYFNKGAAIAQSYERWRIGRDDGWVLFFDSDIEPPDDLVERLDSAGLRKGWLYGAERWQHDPNSVDGKGQKINDHGVPVGFFSLFHTRDDVAMEPGPIVAVDFLHAGNYDSTFTEKWHPTRRKILPGIELIHRGKPGENWCGMGNQDKLQEILDGRKKGKHWRHEKIRKQEEVSEASGSDNQ